MADGIRVVLADQGYDARDFTLLCFGGAGGIHAPALIEELGIRRLVIPLEAATFSALGMLYSDIRYDFVQTLARPLHRTEVGEIVGALDRMREEATERLTRATGAANGRRFEPLADMRYSGQTHELRIALPDRVAAVDDVAGAYERAYESAYGYVGERELIQLVNLRLAATATTPKPTVAAAPLDRRRPGGRRAQGQPRRVLRRARRQCRDRDLRRRGARAGGSALRRLL